MKKGYNATVFVIIGIMMFFSISLFFIIKNTKKDEEFSYLRYNEYNTFTNSVLNEGEMALLYLNDFAKYLNTDLEKAYALLDENYKQSKFPTYELFQSYARNLRFNVEVDSYKVEVVDNNYVFHITANPNVNLIFRTTGVMQYTVEIK